LDIFLLKQAFQNKLIIFVREKIGTGIATNWYRKSSLDGLELTPLARIYFHNIGL
jgi:hypothetical protein